MPQRVHQTVTAGINVNESKTPFWGCGNKPLSCLVKESDIKIRSGDKRGNRKAAKALFGLKVRASLTGITYCVHGFSEKSAQEETFFDAVGKRDVSVAGYLEDKYGIEFQYRHHPCTITNPKKKTIIPLELMFIQNEQRLFKPMSPERTAAMIKFAVPKPQERAAGGMAVMNRVNRSQDPTCQEFVTTVD